MTDGQFVKFQKFDISTPSFTKYIRFMDLFRWILYVQTKDPWTAWLKGQV